MAEQSLPHIDFPGCNFRHSLILFFGFLAMVFLMKSVIGGIFVYVYFDNHQILKVGIFGNQHVYSTWVWTINIFTNICVLAISS
jgi:hypothetical protein